MERNVDIFRKIWRSIRAGTLYFNTDHEWPKPPVPRRSEPFFLFIITPPYSGSTVLAQALNSSPSSTFLQRRAEGQWLVPGMCRVPDAWERNAYMDWDSIRAVWLQRAKLIQEAVQNVEVIIEKSPPNLLRIDKLTEVFPNNAVVAFNRDPYANCSSRLFRRHKPELKTEEETIEIVKLLASEWIDRSLWVKKWISELNLIFSTYENFCENPDFFLNEIICLVPQLKEVNSKKGFKIKDYSLAQISNQNIRQISRLSRGQIKAISEVLENEQNLLEFFGYNIREPHNSS